MAAFIQRLFKKRSSTATNPAPSVKTGDDSRPTTDTETAPRQDQSAIDRQRAILAAQDTYQETLADIAEHGLAADIRLTAARKLTEESLLHRVHKAAKGKDKGVYQHTRQVLQELRRQQDAARETQDAIRQLIDRARELAATEDTKLFEARTQKLEQQWQSLEAEASNEARSEILTSLHTCRQRIQELAAQRQEEQRHQDQYTQRQETLALLRDTLEELASNAAATAMLPSLDALQRTQENRWLEATRDTEVAKQEQKQYEQLMLQLRGTISAVGRLASQRETIDQTLAEDRPSPHHAKQLLKDLEWPVHLAQPEEIKALVEAARVSQPAPEQQQDQQASQQTLHKLEATLQQLEQALAENLLKDSRHYLKQAQGYQKQLTGKLAAQHQGRLQRLAGQVHELGDWRGFATEPKQVSLCEQMEYLAEQPMEPEIKAGHIQGLQQQWRELGGSSNRELWQRFRKASDVAFEPCKAYFEARSDLKQVHLQKRHDICEQLSRYLEATDWNDVDWKAAEQIEKTARREWREAWPVEFRDNRAVQKEFDRLMATLSGHLDEERTRNEAQKQAIVDRSRELIDHDPLAEAMAEAKELQSQWQAIGITRHREDRKLWKAFRASCDQIFGRRDEERQRRQQQTSAADEAATALVDKARHLIESENSDEGLLRDMIRQLSETANTPISAALNNKLRAMSADLEQQIQRHEAMANARQWQQWLSQRLDGQLAESELPKHWPKLQADAGLSNARELVILAEILTGQASPEEDQGLRMEMQVRRLKEGLEGSDGGDTNTAAKLEALVACWCLGLAQEELTENLANRLHHALSGS